MKKIAIITPFVGNRGGGEVFLNNLCIYNLLEDTDNKLLLFTHDWAMFECDTIQIPDISSYKKFFSNFSKLCNIVSSYQPDCIILNDIYLGQFSILFSIKFKNVITLVHGEIDYVNKTKVVNKIVSIVRMCAIYLGSKKILSVNKHNIQLYKNSYKVRFVGNFVLPKESSYSEIKEYTFLFSGRLVYLKNIITMLECFKKYLNLYDKNAKLCIVGDGDQKEEIIQYIFENELAKNVIMPGFVESEILNSYYGTSKALLLFSLTEGFPTVILEALQNGVPCLVSRVGSNDDIIQDGVNGFVFDLKTSQDIIVNLMHDVQNIGRLQCEKSMEKYLVSDFYKNFINEVM